MRIVTAVLLGSFAVVFAQPEVTLEPDVPFLTKKVGRSAMLKCCFSSPGQRVNFTWVKYATNKDKNAVRTVLDLTNPSRMTTRKEESCGILSFNQVSLNDTGMYLCSLSPSKVFTHGTYLRVYIPLEKTINLSESTKNQILTIEGVLLLLCVLLPSATLLLQSKKQSLLEQKKMRKEEENIYQGLNLDDCCSAYDQIERTNAQGQYQDVCNMMEEEEDIQLEKP